METTNFTFADLSRFLRRAPKFRTYAIPTVLFLAADFMIISGDLAFRLFFTALAFGVPLIVVILLDKALVRTAGFHFPTRRINYLNFLSFFFAQIYFLLLRLISPGFLTLPYDVMLAFSTTALLRSMVFYTYFSDRYRNIALPSLGYSAASMVGLSVISMNHLAFLLFALITLVFSVGGYLFAHLSVSSFTNEFGQSPITILNFFLNSRGGQNRENDARTFFQKIYDRRNDVPVQVVDIVTKGGKRKVAMVFPYIHPGPFGNIGTSNIPYKLQSRLAGLDSDLMVFHTTTTNSNNSATEEDIDRIAEAVRTAIGKVSYTDTVSPFRKFNVGNYVVGLLKFGNFGLAAMIPEKERFDDVSLSEGLRLISEMKATGAADFIAVDAQTYFMQGAPSLSSCDNIIEALKKEFPVLASHSTPKIGYASVKVEANAIGPLGVQCLVIETDSLTQALVLTDSNNITGDLINLAKERGKSLVDEIEFFTTDNHYINAGTLDMNPLGQRDDPGLIADAIAECIEKAAADVEECRLGMATSHATVSMGEESTFKRLLDSVHSAIRRARYMIVAIIGSCLFTTISLSYLLYYVVGLT